ncbi:MAG: hypothetical protein JWM31_1594 [Solirubrobacterales bacterium]|nr:hypothetical protein [Solirubrobacterales bacterium]
MENATLTPRRQGPEVHPPAAASSRLRPGWPGAIFALLCVGTLVLTLVYPTYPNYDSVYSLLWGRELLHGVTPSFEAYRAPTEHPLAIAFSVPIALLGEGADRVMLFAALASFLGLVAGLYRLGRSAFTPTVGLVAALILCSRLDFPFLALRGYIDVTYLAFVVWAAAWELERPRTGYRVPLLLAGAALMRPEAWLLAGLYFLWAVWPLRRGLWPVRLRAAAWKRTLILLVLALVGTIVWVALDFAVTGNPIYSLKHTSGLAEELGRTRSPGEIPRLTYSFLRSLATSVVFYAGLAGLLAAIVCVPRRVLPPLALLVVGVGTFFMIGVAGLSVIDRYLLVASLMLMLFAAVAVAGWTMLEPGRLRIAWIVLGVGFLVLGAAKTSTKINRTGVFSELQFRGDSHSALKAILEDPRVVAARGCGPISTPSHKLIPETRWIADLPEGRVLARNDPAHSATDLGRVDSDGTAIRSDHATAKGLALLVTSRQTLLRQAVVEDTDDARDNVPPPGFRRLAYNGTYAIYTSC